MQKQTAPGCLADKKQRYLQLAAQLTGLIRGVPHQTANLANASALLMEAVEKEEILLVENVHTFPGHIACDCASNSEIVLPLHAGGRVVGVLDIDSTSFARFDEEDREGLTCLARILEEVF